MRMKGVLTSLKESISIDFFIGLCLLAISCYTGGVEYQWLIDGC